MFKQIDIAFKWAKSLGLVLIFSFTLLTQVTFYGSYDLQPYVSLFPSVNAEPPVTSPEDEWADEDSSNANQPTAEQVVSESEGKEAADVERKRSSQVEDEEGERGRRQGARIGPGGIRLRSDYPGTPESLQASTLSASKIQEEVENQEKSESEYILRVHELESKVDELRNKVFESKTRIVLLREALLSEAAEGARGVFVFKNELNSMFKIKRVLVSLDGGEIYDYLDKDNTVSDEQPIEVYSSSLSPGTHHLSLFVTIEGDGGFFSYFDGYSFDVSTSCELDARPGKIAIVTMTTSSSGSAATMAHEKPSLSCDVQYQAITVSPTISTEVVKGK